MSNQINELMALLPYKKGSKNYQKCEQIIQDISNVSKDWFSSEAIHESAMRLAVSHVINETAKMVAIEKAHGVPRPPLHAELENMVTFRLQSYRKSLPISLM